MKLFTQAQYAQLLANGRKQQEAMAKDEDFDPMPVCQSACNIDHPSASNIDQHFMAVR